MNDTDELKECLEEFDRFIRCYRGLLNEKPRILRPLQEAREAALVNYRDLSRETQPVG